MRELQSSVEIEAQSERVWGVLVDLDAYPEWNPFIRQIGGPLEPGARLQVRIEPPGRRAMTFRPRVLAVEPNRELRWLGSLFVPRLFDGEHSFVLDQIGPARTRFVQWERFSGALVPLFGKGLVATRLGFEQMNLALKARVEGSP